MTADIDTLSQRLARITEEIANEEDAKRQMARGYNEAIKDLKRKQQQLAKAIRTGDLSALDEDVA